MLRKTLLIFNQEIKIKFDLKDSEMISPNDIWRMVITVFIFLSLTLHVVYQQKEHLTVKICLQKFVLKELASCNFSLLFGSLDIYMGLVFYIYYTTKLH